MAFTNLERSATLKKMSEEEYDVFVIGGGITGSGIALDAVTRGMKVALCEMQDFAGGTSSRSTKLVHGGLRYLKQFEVKMVAEIGKERAVVYENGPHVTTPEWMLLPMYEGGTFGPFTTSIGLRVYDFLAGVKKSERRSMLSKQDAMKKEPLLKKNGLKGGGYYVEYRTDDARLTIEVAKKAKEFGADLINYASVEEFIYKNGKVAGVRVKDRFSGEMYEIHARKIVNATGPWVDKLREKDGSKAGKTLQLTKGVHIVLDQAKFPLKQAIYFDTEDGRMIFAIPRGNKAYIGTTDTFYDSDPVAPHPTKEDRAYLIDAIQYMFPDAHITEQDIESSWAGVRPLILEEGKDPSEISRKDEVWVSDSGLITIAGGKLTGYRKMSEMVVDKVAKQFEQEQYKLFGECQTEHLPISGGDVGGSRKFDRFVEQQVQKGTALGLSRDEASELVHSYGTNVKKIFQILSSGGEDMEKSQLSKEVYARLKYAIDEESLATPVDFFLRRTGALLFNIHWVYQWKEAVIDYMAGAFGWSEEKKKELSQQLEQELKYATTPYEEQH